MKTSGFRCETKFGLLVFLGHPNEDDDDYCEDDDEQKPGLEKPPVATFSDNPPPWED